jgi:hypothetical protein
MDFLLVSQLRDDPNAHGFMARCLLVKNPKAVRSCAHASERAISLFAQVPFDGLFMFLDDANKSRTIIEAIHANCPAQIVAFMKSCPDAGFKDQAVTAAKCEQFGTRLQALDFLEQSQHFAGPYRLCIAIADALHLQARRMVDTGCGDVNTARLIAVRAAIALMTAEQQLGHHDKVVRLFPEIAAWLATLGDTDNLNSLQIKRIASLLELGRFDEAERDIKALQQTVLPPLVHVSLQALTPRLWKCKANGPELALGQAGTTFDGINPLSSQLFGELIRSAAELAQCKAAPSRRAAAEFS